VKNELDEIHCLEQTISLVLGTLVQRTPTMFPWLCVSVARRSRG